MHYDSEFKVVFIVCVALALGAVMRATAKATRVPFTIAVMLLGLGVGSVLRSLGEGGPDLFADVLAAGTDISPHLIIFVFLPALVFESAFALDVYAFRRNVGACVTLAVPALVASTVCIGGLMVLVTSGGWQWSLATALVFGALISATDPVAVVAILRESGAPKRLGVLIEGESLLNDGTAIVAFTVLLGVLMAGGWSAISVGDTALEFVKVVVGGIAVGLVLAVCVSETMGRTFNDPTLEITLTIVLAYACMIVAEGLLHVSGVMALVTAGLYMGGPGRTRISPEVEHFLHEFWEMVAYIANTLIFFLVGLVVAKQVHSMDVGDVLLIAGVYALVMVVRFGVTFAFLPAINLVSERVSTREATVMSWGGMRGAVSLALGLIVFHSEGIPEDLRGQILLVTAGVVFLTIAVNGSATGWVLSRLKFTVEPPAHRVARLTALSTVLDDVRERISDVSKSRELRTVSWADVREDLHARRRELETELEAAHRDLDGATGAERAAGYWLQALRMERQSYWSAFAHGTLGPIATRILDREIDAHVDRLSKGERGVPLSRVPGLLRDRQRSRQFDRLALLYDVSRAEAQAAGVVLAWLDGLDQVDASVVAPIRRCYELFQRGGKERLEDLRSNLPEITQAIETRLARRIQLNFERDGYEAMRKRGTMEGKVVATALAGVEARMKALRRLHRVPLPETAELCRTSPLFQGLDEGVIGLLADMTVERALAPGDVLVSEGDAGDSMFIVARGAVHVIKRLDGEDIVLSVLGGGDVVGEMSLLTGAPRSATIKAATTVTLGEISRADFDQLMDTQPEMRARIWAAFAQHRFDNRLRDDPRFAHLGPSDRVGWIHGREVVVVAEGERIDVHGCAYLFVLTGDVDVGGATAHSPTLAQVPIGAACVALTEARVVGLPPFERR